MTVYLLVWVWWLPKGKDVLYVSSDSPIWREYMETEVFPLVAQRAIVLSWSARSKWPRWSFAVRVFRTFGGGRNFNPMVVLFRPFGSKDFRLLSISGTKTREQCKRRTVAPRPDASSFTLRREGFTLRAEGPARRYYDPAHNNSSRQHLPPPHQTFPIATNPRLKYS